MMTKRKRYFNVTISGHFQALDEGEAAMFLHDAIAGHDQPMEAIVIECDRKGRELSTATFVNLDSFQIVERLTEI